MRVLCLLTVQLAVLSVACSPASTEPDAGGPAGGSAGGGRAGGSAAGGNAAPARLSASPMSVTFGQVPAGNVSAPIAIEISNTGGQYTGPLEVVLEGDRFRLVSNACALDSLFGGGSCGLSVAFAPVAVVSSVGSIVVRGNPGGEVTISLAGTGTTPTSTALTVTKTGSGRGTVTGMGIDCGADCMESGAVGRSVSLSATAAVGSTLGGWTGCDSVASTVCGVTMATNRTVTANFIDTTMGGVVVLTVNKDGTGSGTVMGMGIACGADCTESVSVGSQVVLTAAPAMNAVFAGWAGCDSTTSNTCTLTLTANRTVTATFEAAASAYQLTVVKAGTGSGTVTGTGIMCGTDCNELVPAGQSRTVTATPAAGSLFSGWAGCDMVSGQDCVVSVASSRTVTATFTSNPSPSAPTMLTAMTTLSGAVELRWTDTSAIELDFRVDRSAMASTGFVEIATLPANTTMTTLTTLMQGTHYLRVRATNNGGSSAPSNTVVVTVLPPSHLLTAATAGQGSGTIVSAPVGISCGTDCTEAYPQGTTVVLSANPQSGSTFASWSGCGTVAGNTCTVVMNSPATVTATFDVQVSPITLSVPPTNNTGAYTVSWFCPPGSCGSMYTLQEDVSPAFSAPTSIPVTGTTQSFVSRPNGTYCYRVRDAVLWSNTGCVTVQR
ncbi:MAG: fibronectin type III domain-containing protein [Myxococcaceae bacterium]|nr:fibronectin type III domain-containing protein [Myxococcaceae bacterium]